MIWKLNWLIRLVRHSYPLLQKVLMEIELQNEQYTQFPTSVKSDALEIELVNAG